jgi:2,5-diketo-D-gluconate reductase B
MKIPKLGLGTWQNTDPKRCAESVRTALELGYRHIDTAQMYQNEEHVGQGIKQSGVPRADVFLATKVWINNLDYEGVRASTQQSLRKLHTDYIDLLYIHWPAGKYNPEDTLRAFNELREEGMIRNIGVCNFTVPLLEEAMRISDSPIVANQVETHPFLHQDEMGKFLQKHGMTHVAYSPLARGRVLKAPELAEIAEKYNATEAQVSLAWLWSHEGLAAIPKSSNREHLQENFEATNLRLDNEDIKRIGETERKLRIVDPGFSPNW